MRLGSKNAGYTLLWDAPGRLESALAEPALQPRTRLPDEPIVALDLMRSAAAVVVFCHHANVYGLDRGLFDWLRPDVGHSAVVVFFVLSGYVIAASAARADSGLGFAIKRASRIYSVALPAVLLSFALAKTAQSLHLPPDAPDYQLAKPWAYILLALTFSSQLWTLAEPIFSNEVYWSLSYEVWYYVLFGCAVFCRGPWRLPATAAVFALMGPKLWALLPIWLAGVLVYQLQLRGVPRAVNARRLVAAALLLLVAFKLSPFEPMLNSAVQGWLHGWSSISLHFSSNLAGDTVLGSIVALLVYSVGPARFSHTAVTRLVASRFAGISYSLYLVHLPLLLFFGALLPSTGLLPMPISFVCSVSFGLVFERQRYGLVRLCRWMLGQIGLPHA